MDSKLVWSVEGTLAGPALGLEGRGTLEGSRGPKFLTPGAPVLLRGPVMTWDSWGGHATAWGWHRALDPAEGSNRADGAWWGLWLRLWGEGLGEVGRALGLSRGAQGRGQAWPTRAGVLVGGRRGQCQAPACAQRGQDGLGRPKRWDGGAQRSLSGRVCDSSGSHARRALAGAGGPRVTDLGAWAGRQGTEMRAPRRRF